MAIYQSGVELSDAEVDQITSFLKTLTGEYNGVPVTSDNSRDDIHGH
jgi:cytochrome c peroxidase